MPCPNCKKHITLDESWPRDWNIAYRGAFTKEKKKTANQVAIEDDGLVMARENAPAQRKHAFNQSRLDEEARQLKRALEASVFEQSAFAVPDPQPQELSDKEKTYITILEK